MQQQKICHNLFSHQGGLATCTRWASDRASKTTRRRLSRGILSHHQWFLVWFDNPQECGESRQSVHAGQEPANQAGHQGGPVWPLLVKRQPLTQPLFMRGLLRSNVKDHFKCWIYDLVFLLSGKIQLDLDVWTHLTANIDVMVLLRKSNCSSCNILGKRPSFDA